VLHAIVLKILLIQLYLQVLKKFGVEKFDPTNEPFDPHRHNAVFQVPDDSKPPGTVAAVLNVI
jgi:molecular chaperone GrpE